MKKAVYIAIGVNLDGKKNVLRIVFRIGAIPELAETLGVTENRAPIKGKMNRCFASSLDNHPFFCYIASTACE